MDIKYLYTVKKIIETGSYQAAADALNYAQSTITFQVKQLEQELGVTLFVRNGLRMELSEAGKQLLPMIDRVLLDVDSLKSYRSLQDGLYGTMTVALPESLATYQFEEIISAFHRQAPNVKMVLKVMNCYAIHKLLEGSDIDIAIHYDVGSYNESITTKALCTYPLALIGSPNLSVDEKDFITPKQNKYFYNIQNDSEAISLKKFRSYLLDKSITMDEEMEVWSIEAIKRYVAKQMGVAMLPRFTVTEEIENHTLEEIKIDMDRPEITAIYAVQNSKWRSPAMELFIDIMSQHFGI